MEIQFNKIKYETSSGINFYGSINIKGHTKNVECSVTYEFLQDINNGSIQHIETFESNLWTIEQIADDKLNALLPIDLENDLIKIKILSADRKLYNL